MVYSKPPDSGLEVDYSKEGLQASHGPARMEPDAQPAYHYPQTGDKEEARQRKSTNPWSLSPVAFGLLIALITAIVVGAAVGGGVGGSRSKSPSCPASSSSPTSSAVPLATSSSNPSMTSSSAAASSSSSSDKLYTPLLPDSVPLLNYTCPALPRYEHVIYQYPTTQTFTWHCEIGYLGSDRGESGATLTTLSAYTPVQCLEACGNHNAYVPDIPCEAFTWIARMEDAYVHNSANCWLFSNSTGTLAAWQDTPDLRPHYISGIIET